MIQKIFTILTFLGLRFFCCAQSVYMHEAQEEPSDVSIKDLIYGAILIFIIYIVVKIINSIFKSTTNKSKERSANKVLHQEKPEPIRNPIISNSTRPYTFTIKGTAPKRNLSEEEDAALHDIKCNEVEIIGGYPAVDLGLDVCFSIKNLGADNIEDEGDKYSWGSMDAVKKHLPYSESEINNITIDELNIIGLHSFQNLNSYTGNSKYDPAAALMGNGWRTPTIHELKQLMDKCKWVYLDKGKIRGYKITGPNNNFIFIPMGFDVLYQFGDVGVTTNILSSTASEDSVGRTINGRYIKCAKHFCIVQYPREEYPTLKIQDIIRPLAAFIRPVIRSPYIRVNYITEQL